MSNICLDDVLHLNDLFLAKLLKAYPIFDPIVDVMPIVLMFFFLLAFV